MNLRSQPSPALRASRKPLVAAAHRSPERPAPEEPRSGAGIDSEARIALAIDPAAAGRWLGFLALLLVALHAWIHLLHYRVVQVSFLVRGLFDLDQEQSVGTWYAAFLLLCAAGVSLACAQRPADRVQRRGWRWLGAGFVALSIDEVAGLHESFNTATEISWAVPGALLVLLVGVGSWPFLRRLPSETARRVLVAGAVFAAGAIGVELATAPLAEHGGMQTLRYALATALEEGLEMAGAILFVSAGLRHLASPARSQR